jgi:hypothetical protein
MRYLLAAPLLVAGLIGTSAPADACSIRGQWCGYPYWAANAFEAPRDRVQEGALPVRPIIRQGYYGYVAPEVYGYGYGYGPVVGVEVRRGRHHHRHDHWR